MGSDLEILFRISLFEDAIEQEWSWGFNNLKDYIQHLRQRSNKSFHEYESEAIRELLILDPNAKATLIQAFDHEPVENLKVHLALHIVEAISYEPAQTYLKERSGKMPFSSMAR